MDVPRVRPTNSDVGAPAAPKYEVLPKVPRMIILGPSGGGKTELMTSMLTEMYVDGRGRSIFSRIYVFSPSVHLDGAWTVVKEFVRKNLKVDAEKEQCFFDRWDPRALSDIYALQRKVVATQKERKDRKMFQIALIIDDFADDRAAMHSPQLIEAFVRGRHINMTTIVSVQKYRVLDNAIRVNCTHLCVFRLRSAAEREAVIEENDDVLGREGLEEAYRLAVNDEPYSFLFLRLVERDPRKFAYLRFERPLYDDIFGPDPEEEEALGEEGRYTGGSGGGRMGQR